jgi:hypothetical protein
MGIGYTITVPAAGGSKQLFWRKKMGGIVDDIYPVRRDIDDQIDDLDEIGIA